MSVTLAERMLFELCGTSRYGFAHLDEMSPQKIWLLRQWRDQKLRDGGSDVIEIRMDTTWFGGGIETSETEIVALGPWRSVACTTNAK